MARITSLRYSRRYSLTQRYYELNSANDSAQSRKRLYWTNIKFTRSKDKGIVLNDILEDGGMADRDESIV